MPTFTGLGGEVIWLCPSLDDSPDDLSGNGNNGTYVNGVSTVADTEFGGSRAYQFDGTNQGISFSYISSMNLVTEVSYAFWFNKSSASFSNYVLNKGGSSKRSPWINTYGNGRWESQVQFSNGTNTFYNGFGQGQYDQWDHIALSWDGVISRHYVNGNLVDKEYHSRGITTVNDYGATYSISRLSGGAYGLMDDIRIFNRALKSVEVKYLYSKRGITGPHNFALFTV